MKLEFPVNGLLPKEETQASSFLRKHPEYDGRNTIIAVLDTGVDPGAPGLNITTDGKSKIVDVVDCTGSGDVALSLPIKSTLVKDENSTDSLQVLNGLSGRRLILNSSWVNPSGGYRLGLKHAYELFPAPVLSRVKEIRKELFIIDHTRMVSEVQSELAALENTLKTSELDKDSQDRDQRKSEIQARLDSLKGLLEKYDDPGPIYDCVVFYDGQYWRAIIDTKQSGDLRDQPVLASYRFQQQYHRFSDQDNLNFSVNIYDEGNTLSIVAVAGSHGTHVAAIAAAHYPNDPALNGIAPGAQIVSLKIGDTRLGSMETGPGLSRAILAMIQNHCDLANISYGEAASVPNVGRFIELLRDVAVNQYGIIVVSSGGNAGPALTTVGAPGGTTSGIISVGAHVGHNQMAAEYALLQSVPEREYTWSSRGPTTDGDAGINIYAPGSAITSVPTYQLQKAQLMNGTSMSSPNACGNLALLVSGWKKECPNMKINSHRIFQAITNTGYPVETDPFKTPFLQIDKAFTHLIKHKTILDQELFYNITLTNNKRGVYLRELNETSRIISVTATVTPTFPKDPVKPTWDEYWQDSQMKVIPTLSRDQSLAERNSEKLELDIRLALIATKPWVKAPAFVHFNTGGRAFPIQVDPTALSPGLHIAEIQAWDTTSHDKGVLFKIPITVCKPEIPLEGGVIRYHNIAFSAGQIDRKFISVPEGAMFADLTVRSKSPCGQLLPAKFTIQLLQLLAHTRYVRHEHEYSYTLGNESYLSQGEAKTHEVHRFKVMGGVTLEMCLAQFWSSPSEHSVSIELIFHGVQITSDSSNSTPVSNNYAYVWINGSDAVSRLDVVSNVRREEDVSFTGSFDVLRKHIRPSDAVIRPLSATRDIMPNTRQVYNLVLTYNVKITEVNMSITPRFPVLNELLYDSPHDAILVLIFDVNKMLLATHDVYPKQIKLVAKGDYTIRLQVRHDAIDYLERLQSTVLCLDYSIKAIPLEFNSSLSNALNGKKNTFSKQILDCGDRRTIFVNTPDNLPKEVKAGDVLYGDLTVNEGGVTKVDGGCYRVAIVAPPEKIPPKEPTSTVNSTDTKVDEKTLYIEAVRDIKISWLKKATGDLHITLVQELQKEYPTHLPTLAQRLEVLSENGGVDKVNEVITLANEILTQADVTTVASYFALKQDPNDTDKKKKKYFEKRKEIITSTLYRKALAIQQIVKQKKEQNDMTGYSAATKDFDKAFIEYQKWALPPNSPNDAIPDAKFLNLVVASELAYHRPGTALKAIQKFLAEVAYTNETKEDLKNAWKQKQELLHSLQWNAWSKYEKEWSLIRVKSEYAGF